MTRERLRIVFLVDAAFSALGGLLFLAGTWDGLYDAIEFPQGQPAIDVQIGGAALVGVAYLLWVAARTPSLMLPMARAAALMNGLGAGVVVAWLINGELGIADGGYVLLAVIAIGMAIFTVLYLLAATRPGGYGPEPPPAPPAA